MSKKLLVVLLVALLSVGLYAGDKANFSGEWKYCEEKSDLDDMGMRFLPTGLTVTQEADKVTIVKTMEGMNGEEMQTEETITLDGKENELEGWGGSTRLITAKWNETGDVLKFNITIHMEFDGQKSTIDMVEKWSLKEGVLMLDHFSSSDFGERDVDIAYKTVEK